MELIFDLVILGVSIILFGSTYAFTGLNIKTGGGPAFWPRVLLILIIALDIVLILFSYKKFKKGELKSKKDENAIYPNNLYITIGSLLAYIILMQYIGFLISTVLFIAFLMYILKVNRLRTILTSLISGYVITFVFAKLLMVPLPQGVSVFRIFSQVLGV